MDRPEYTRIYMANATQLATYRLAREWMPIEPDPEVAARWASLAYTPAEAKPLIEAGITPDMAADMEAIDRGDDSPEEHAARVLDMLAERGLQIRPGE